MKGQDKEVIYKIWDSHIKYDRIKITGACVDVYVWSTHAHMQRDVYVIYIHASDIYSLMFKRLHSKKQVQSSCHIQNGCVCVLAYTERVCVCVLAYTKRVCVCVVIYRTSVCVCVLSYTVCVYKTC